METIDDRSGYLIDKPLRDKPVYIGEQEGEDRFNEKSDFERAMLYN